MPRNVKPLSVLDPLIDRRLLLRAGVFGLAAAPMPVLAARFGGASGFTHNVASGEPQAHSVLLWTRYRAASGDPAALRYELSQSIDFRTVVGGGEVEASPDRDWCAKAVATGLAPDSWYYYRFIAPDGSISPVGRTRTLPVGEAARWRIAVFSCSNLGFGWFNAYAHAAEAGDFDMAVHLGDYLYEYPLGQYPSKNQTVEGRVLAPDNEIVALADYRIRYAAYRSDPDLQRVHQLYPFITVPDDHESANDSWKGGAQNHQPETEGEWSVRKRAAMQANREWLPVSDDPWASYDIGDLATVFRVETRLIARDKPFDLSELVAGKPAEEVLAALERFRSDAWRDPSRSLMGVQQEGWLAQGLKASVGSGKRWQVLAQQVVMASLVLPNDLAVGMGGDAPDYVRRRIETASVAVKAGMPFNMDAWDGYPAARDRLLASAREAEANLVVLAGDSHNAWASNLEGAGVEFAGQSVTSPGAENSLRWIAPEALARRLVEQNDQLQWADTGQRGYMALELTRDRAECEYRFMQSVRHKTTQLASTKRLGTAHGARRIAV